LELLPLPDVVILAMNELEDPQAEFSVWLERVREIGRVEVEPSEDEGVKFLETIEVHLPKDALT